MQMIPLSKEDEILVVMDIHIDFLVQQIPF